MDREMERRVECSQSGSQSGSHQSVSQLMRHKRPFNNRTKPINEQEKDAEKRISNPP